MQTGEEVRASIFGSGFRGSSTVRSMTFMSEGGGALTCCFSFFFFFGISSSSGAFLLTMEGCAPSIDVKK